MSEERWTRDQLRVIQSRGKDMLVSASAGSGKTTVMIRRIISLIEDGASLSEMVVCTFTKASAADMRAKLYGKLKELSSADERFTAQLALLPTAQISTIHSFCQNIIKTYFYAVDIDPDFEIADEKEASALFSACAESTVDKFLRSGDADFAELYEIMLKKRTGVKLVSLIKRIYDFAACQEDFEAWLDGCLKQADKHAEHVAVLCRPFGEAFAVFLKQAEDLMRRTEDAGFTRNAPFCRELVSAIGAKKKCDCFPRGKVGGNEYYSALDGEFRSLREKYNGFINRYTDAADCADPSTALAHSRVLTELVRETAKTYAAVKKKKAVTDYSDLEHNALKILMNPDARAALEKKYKYIFVDEYQDVNPLQESLIQKLGGMKFFVGDVKQSIYAFRMCDSEIFVNKYNRYKSEGGGEAAELNANFRSEGRILEFCNEVFSDIMTEKFGRVDYRRNALFVAGRGCGNKNAVSAELAVFEPQKPSPPSGIYSVKNHVNPENDSDLTDAETELALKRIEKLLKDGNAPGDIAVLLRACRTEWTKTLARKLIEKNIPAFVSDERRADENAEINTLIHALKYIDNSRDDVALCAVMRSYLGGFSDDDIAEIRERDNFCNSDSGRERFFFEAARGYASDFGADADLRKRLTAFFEKFSRYSLLSKTVKVSSLLGTVCAESGFFKYVYSLADGDAKAQELACFLDVAENSSYGDTLGDFIKNLEREMPAVSAAPPSDAVRIMTVHASKGLEFKHVIFGNAGRKFDKRDLYLNPLLDSELGLALKKFDTDGKKTRDTSLYLRIAAEKERKLKEEEMRILYVALTRAKETLYICGSAKKLPEKTAAEEAESFLDWLYPHIESFAEIYSFEDVLGIKDAESDRSEPEPETVFGEPLERVITEYITEHPDEKRRPHKTTVTKAARESEGEDETAAQLAFADAERGAAVGSAYHLLMQHIDFSADFESEWSRLRSEYPNECAVVKKSAVEKAHATIAETTAGKTFYRELPFTVRLDINGDGEMLVQGVIDLLIESDGKYEIIDYKSGEISEKYSGAYKKQVDIYAAAAEKILGVEVTDRNLYSFASGSLIKI